VSKSRRQPGALLRRKDNEELFSAVAGRYEATVDWLSLGRDRRWKRLVVKSAALRPKDRCLDVGCGTGVLTNALAQSAPSALVVGLDLVLPMLGHVKRGRTSNVFLTQQDMSSMGLSDATFDVVTASYALRNAPDLDAALREVARVLREGGHLVFLDFYRPASRWQRIVVDLGVTAWSLLIGSLSLGSIRRAFSISTSLRRYPPVDELSSCLARNGFSAPSFWRLALGTVAIGKCMRVATETTTTARSST